MLSIHPLNFQTENFLQHPWNFLKTPWKFPLNRSKTSFNDSQNFFETPLKLPQNIIKGLLKLSWNNLETSYPWNLHETPIRLPLNTFVTPYAKEKLLHDGRTDKWTEWQHHFLSCSLQLEMVFFFLQKRLWLTIFSLWGFSSWTISLVKMLGKGE